MVNLPGIGFLGGVASPRVATYRDSSGTNATNTTFSFSGLAIGPAYPDRRVLVPISARGNTTIGVINSVTVGGIAAPVIAQFNNISGGNISISAFAIADVPTGVTATVVVTFSTSKLRCGVAVYDISGIGVDTPLDTQSATFGTPPNINVIEGSCVIGMGFSAANTSYTWASITEDYDIAFSNTFSGASKNGYAAGTAPWDCTPGSGSDPVKLAISF